MGGNGEAQPCAPRTSEGSFLILISLPSSALGAGQRRPPRACEASSTGCMEPSLGSRLWLLLTQQFPHVHVPGPVLGTEDITGLQGWPSSALVGLSFRWGSQTMSPVKGKLTVGTVPGWSRGRGPGREDHSFLRLPSSGEPWLIV